MDTIGWYSIGIPSWGYQVPIGSSNKALLILLRIPIVRKQFGIKSIYKYGIKETNSSHLQEAMIGTSELAWYNSIHDV